ncbi:tRNA lysidine(34) synthetase TilS [Pseudoluteimonas lycopersici]|uniref:tRNA(Ile)-lysidine synthase n=1 Tax=Pseudoluteimonas lycopersici TaxID=1324796 RepID=A0A516V424_9GAMM|nr:tRNA lysidine(34) synthetase TilS [Lysobacter lycopersici]QDQ73282.1 tRNA lysidine(34) synthetase TilS [Lysobacter lycopersici]
MSGWTLPPPPPAASVGVLIGLSGGLDSTVLLHLLAHSPLRPNGLRAIHVHHGLHPDADAWAAHCESLCAALDVPLTIVRIEVDRASGLGLEGAARESRHAAFKSELRDGEILALAHHRDDQAETFLLRALRGSGTKGLSSMQSWRRHGYGWLWRPLLAQPREALREYAIAHDLIWIEDPSNASNDPDRNFLRNRVMPVLQERWPQASTSFARSAALIAEAHDILSASDMNDLDRITHHDDSRTIHIAGLMHLPAPRRARALQLWAHRLGLPPLPGSAPARIEKEIIPASKDAEPRFCWSGACIERWNQLLHADRQSPVFPRGWARIWDGCTPLRLPEGSLLSLDGGEGFKSPVLVRARLGGERINLHFRTHSHALKKVLQEHRIPPWERRRLPLLLDPDSETVLAAGHRIIGRDLERRLVDPRARLDWQLA